MRLHISTVLLNGLRDYGIPLQIWGGDPEHEHVWGDHVTGAGTNHVDKRRWNHAVNGRGEEQPEAKQVTELRPDVAHGAFCECGAWRGSLGLEPTPQLFVEHMVLVFREVRRVLRSDGTCWLNLGDSYATGAGKVGNCPGGGEQGERWAGYCGTRDESPKHSNGAIGPMIQPNQMPLPGLKPKDLIGVPWRVAFALQDDGWWLRQDIVWAKPSPMPESVRDRCTKAHEYIFLLAKSQRYFYDADAIKERSSQGTHPRLPGNKAHRGATAYEEGEEHHRTKGGLVDYAARQRKLAANGSGIKNNSSFDAAMAVMPAFRNKRSVWTMGSSPTPEAHFATFPVELAETCILAGSSGEGCCAMCGAPWVPVIRRETGNAPPSHNGRSFTKGKTVVPHKNTGTGQRTVHAALDGWKASCGCGADKTPCTVLDPFSGAGTSGLAALKHGRRYLGIELNPEYIAISHARLDRHCPLLAAIR